MSHITGTVQVLSPTITIGPDSGQAATSPNTWLLNFAYTPAPTGTKLVMLHFMNVVLPANNRLEVDLGYGTDVFTSADGDSFWTRPVNVYLFPSGQVTVRYITNGATTGHVVLDQYGRGERHIGEPGHQGTAANPTLSNCDPFLKDASYTEPVYDNFWFGASPPQWENVACIGAPADVRARVARSVGMIITVGLSEYGTGLMELSTCTVTLVDATTVICAGHCHTPEEAMTGSVIFGYEVNCDGSKPAGYAPVVIKVKAALFQKYNNTGDYSLLQLASAPPGIPIIQMRHDLPAPGEQVFGIHHPNAAVKKLTPKHPGFGTVLSSSASGINVDYVAVSGGSSGSGLFDLAGRILGVLSNGNPQGVPSSPLYYWPTASILTDIAPAPPAPVTRDVMVVFDRSGSMSADDGTGRTKIEAARDALSLFIQLVKAGVGNRLGLVSFSTTASSPVDFAIAPVTVANKVTLIGNAPYSGGKTGALVPNGATSIGGGLDAARQQFPVPGANPRAILLMTDGLENTPPMIADVTGALAGIDIHAIGFGTEANLNGTVLTQLTQQHNGLYTRAESGIALEKFFSHAFGNIFEAGVSMDPEYVLGANQYSGTPIPFLICGETMITAVIGWDNSTDVLFIEVTTPGGAVITNGTAGTETATGKRWSFLRIPLPHGGERDGSWKVNVLRAGGGGEFPPPAPALNYFINLIPTGGPRLFLKTGPTQFYTGDGINPMVFLRFDPASWPDDVQMKLTVSSPTVSAGTLLSRQPLAAPTTVDADTIPALQATLMQLQASTGTPPIPYSDAVYALTDTSADTDGKFEAGGLYGKRFPDLLKAEGNYTFHFVASYGSGCVATRELFWTIHVSVGIDGGQSTVTVTYGSTNPDGTVNVTIVVVPKDKYGNLLGPGRTDVTNTFTGTAGTTLNPGVVDNGYGSYTFTGTFDNTGGGAPGVVVNQPGKPPVVIVPGGGTTGHHHHHHWKKWFWIMLVLAILFLLLFLLALLL